MRNKLKKAYNNYPDREFHLLKTCFSSDMNNIHDVAKHLSKTLTAYNMKPWYNRAFDWIRYPILAWQDLYILCELQKCYSELEDKDVRQLTMKEISQIYDRIKILINDIGYFSRINANFKKEIIMDIDEYESKNSLNEDKRSGFLDNIRNSFISFFQSNQEQPGLFENIANNFINLFKINGNNQFQYTHDLNNLASDQDVEQVDSEFSGNDDLCALINPEIKLSPQTSSLHVLLEKSVVEWVKLPLHGIYACRELGILENEVFVSWQSIRQNYLKKAKLTHPDKTGRNESEDFKRIKRAYTVLKKIRLAQSDFSEVVRLSDEEDEYWNENKEAIAKWWEGQHHNLQFSPPFSFYSGHLNEEDKIQQERASWFSKQKMILSNYIRVDSRAFHNTIINDIIDLENYSKELDADNKKRRRELAEFEKKHAEREKELADKWEKTHDELEKKYAELEKKLGALEKMLLEKKTRNGKNNFQQQQTSDKETQKNKISFFSGLMS
jgi:curved DNA-binding protein CbpA